MTKWSSWRPSCSANDIFFSSKPTVLLDMTPLCVSPRILCKSPCLYPPTERCREMDCLWEAAWPQARSDRAKSRVEDAPYSAYFWTIISYANTAVLLNIEAPLTALLIRPICAKSYIKSDKWNKNNHISCKASSIQCLPEKQIRVVW